MRKALLFFQKQRGRDTNRLKGYEDEPRKTTRKGYYTLVRVCPLKGYEDKPSYEEGILNRLKRYEDKPLKRYERGIQTLLKDTRINLLKDTRINLLKDTRKGYKPS